jgi:alkylation response protein AidB-like acyl-CoA dehydrogenase
VIEAIAAADASPAWCLAQAVASSHAAGFLAPKIAREVFGARDALVAWGPPAGIAKAVAVPGGYRVSGKWRFASGSANATWMGGHSTVFEPDGEPRRDAHGNPVNRTMLFRKEHAHIHDSWHVIGLRGTASNDYEVSDLFVPDDYTTWRDSAADRRESGPLYNIPLLTLYGVGFSGVALGIAHSCLAAFMALAQTKRSGGGVGSSTLLRDNAVIQSQAARATGRLRSARAFLLQMLAEVWAASGACGTLTLEQRAQLRIAITGRWKRRAKSSISPITLPAPPRSSKAARSSAGFATCTRPWRKGRPISPTSSRRGRRCSGSSRASASSLLLCMIPENRCTVFGIMLQDSASPRISRGCEAIGATPSRISARRNGPTRSAR